MANPRVLITGAGGFIGRHLVRHQLELGRQVRALDRDVAGLANAGSLDRLEILEGDVAEVDVQR